jgi:hypothetical protein
MGTPAAGQVPVRSDARNEPTPAGQAGRAIVAFLMTCRDASRALSRMQDDDVAWWVRMRVRLHLVFCVACVRFARQLRFLRAALRRFSS